MTDNRFPHAHTVIDRAQRRIPHLAGALVRQDVEALVELAREQADELDRIGRARLALAAVRLIATESVTETAEVSDHTCTCLTGEPTADPSR